MPGNIDKHVHIEALANIVNLVDVHQEGIDRDFRARAAGIRSFRYQPGIRRIDFLCAQ